MVGENDLDVFLGNWMPSMTNDIKDYIDDKSVETVTQNLEGAATASSCRNMSPTPASRR